MLSPFIHTERLVTVAVQNRPLQNRPLQKRPLQNRQLQNRPKYKIAQTAKSPTPESSKTIVHNDGELHLAELVGSEISL